MKIFRIKLKILKKWTKKDELKDKVFYGRIDTMISKFNKIKPVVWKK